MKTSMLLITMFIASIGYSMDQATCVKRLSRSFVYNHVDLEYKSEGYYVCGEKNKKQFDTLISRGFNAESSLVASYYSLRLSKFRKTKTLKTDLENACKFLTSEEVNGMSENEIYEEVMSCYVNSARWAYPSVEDLRDVISDL